MSSSTFQVETATPTQLGTSVGEARQPLDETKNVMASVSPVTSTISTGLTTAPSPRRWSSMSSQGLHESPGSTETPIPIGAEWGKLGGVFSFFKTRTSSITRTSTITSEERKIHETLQVARQHVERLTKEASDLRQQVEHTQRELQMRQSQLEILDGTNLHCQNLLKRNSDLEMLVAQIQDEADVKEGSLRRELQKIKTSALDREQEITHLQEQLANRNKTCCREAAALQAARAENLARELVAKEDELGQLKRDFEVASVEAQAAKDRVQMNTNELNKLRMEKLSSFNRLSDVSEEIKRLLRETASLEEQLENLRHQKVASEEALRKSLRIAESESCRKEVDLRNALTDIDGLKQALSEAQQTSQQLMDANSKLQSRLRENELRSAHDQNLMAQLRESEERRRMETQHYEETVVRLKAQLSSFKEVHSQAGELLKRNSHLEKALDTQLKSLQGVDTTQNKELHGELRRRDHQLHQLEARLVEEKKNNDLHEKTIRDLHRKLQATEIAATKIHATPLDAERRAMAIQEAVEAAVTQSSVDSEKMIAGLRRKYDILISDIRKSHQSELNQKEREIESRIRAAVSAKTKAMMELLKEKEKEWISGQKARDTDFDKMCLEKEKEMKRYRAAFEASLAANYDRKLKQVAEERDRNLTDLQADYEQKLKNAQAEADHQLRKLKEEYRQLINEKDADLGRLTATADTLSESYRLLESSFQEKVLERAKEEANLLLVHKEAALYEKLTNDQLEFEKKRDKLHEELEARICTIQEEEKTLRDSLMKERDDIENRANTRIQDMQHSIQNLIKIGTADMDREVQSLRGKVEEMTTEREVFRNREIQLQKDIHKLNGIIQERDSTLESIQREYNTAETQWRSNIEYFKTALVLQSQRDLSPNAPQDFVTLVRRNSDLEKLLADVSERHHNDLRQKQSDLTKARRSIAQLENRVSQVTRENEDLKIELQRKPVSPPESLHTQIKEMTNEVSVAKAEQAKLTRELERSRIRAHDLEQDLKKALIGNPDRQQYQRDLIGKLSQLQEMITETSKIGIFKENDLACAEHDAAQQRLNAEIEFLKSQMAARQKRISDLEAAVDEMQTSLSRPLSDEASTVDNMKAKLRDVQEERNAFAAECKLLQEQLQKQASTITREILRRDTQLTGLKTTNERVSVLLARNTELEDEIKNLFKKMREKLAAPDLTNAGKTIQSDFAIHDEISETLTIFEHEFHSRSQQHEAELRKLSKAIEDRDNEIHKLQVELTSLRQNLERVYNEELQSHRLSFETEKKGLLRDIDNLKDARSILETQLGQLRRDLSEAQAFDTERVDKMISELTHKMKDQQLMMAELQDEKDNEIRRIESRLNSSYAAQKHLEDEIRRVSLELHQKENEILDLSTDLQRIMKENDCLTTEASGSAAASEQEWKHLMASLEHLFEKLVTSQTHANNLILTLQALLKEQEHSLDEMTRTQEAVSQARMKMTNLVATSGIENNFSDVVGMRSSILHDTQKTKEALQKSSGDSWQQVSIMKASIESKQDALEKLKEKSRRRDEELAHMRAKLTCLQLHEGLIQDMHNTDSSHASVTQEAVSSILAAEGGVGALSAGLESLRKDLEELKELRRNIETRRSSPKSFSERQGQTLQSRIVHRNVKLRDLTIETTAQSNTHTHKSQLFSISSSPESSDSRSSIHLSSPVIGILDSNKRKISSLGVEDSIKKIRG